MKRIIYTPEIVIVKNLFFIQKTGKNIILVDNIGRNFNIRCFNVWHKISGCIHMFRLFAEKTEHSYRFTTINDGNPAACIRIMLADQYMANPYGFEYPDFFIKKECVDKLSHFLYNNVTYVKDW